TLARSRLTLGFWTELARMSVFLLWIGLTGAALLCWAGNRLRGMSAARGSTAVLAIISGLVAAISLAAWYFGRTDFAYQTGVSTWFPSQPWEFTLRNVLISFIVTALALRYFYITHQWR